jgi:fibronectin type 3 domain-containing protein
MASQMREALQTIKHSQIMKSINLLSIILFLLSPLTVFAQPPKALTFSDGQTVYLRWPPQRSATLEGYHVYRRENGAGEWRRLTEAPLQMVRSTKDIQAALGAKAGLYLSLYGIEGQARDLTDNLLAEFYRQPDAVAFMEAMSLANPEFGDVQGVIYRDDAILQGRRYQYRITAVERRKETEVGQTGLLTADEAQAVPTVEEVQGQGQNRRVVVSWKKDRALMRKGEIVSYRVYRGESTAGPWRPINASGILSATVSGGGETLFQDRQEFADILVSNGMTYYYHVRAVNAFGLESAPSRIVAVTPADDRTPSPPRELEARRLGAGLQLQWQIPEGEVRSYEIHRSEEREGPYQRVFPAGGASPRLSGSWIDFGAAEGKSYFYYMIAVGNENLRSRSSDTLFVFSPDENPPAAPANLTAESREGQIRLRWDTNAEADLAGYAVERSTDPDFKSAFLLDTRLIRENRYVDELPPQSQSAYYYRVIAVDQSDNRSRPSEVVSSRLPDKTPPMTPILTGLKNEGAVATLRWTANPEEDFGFYRVYRSRDRAGDWQQIRATVGTDIRDTLPDEGKYYYTVAVVDKSGNHSPYAEPLLFTYEIDRRPVPPPGGRVRLENGNLILEWQPAPAEVTAGYLIRRTRQSTGAVTDLAQLKADARSYTDKRALTKERYLYEVIAFDSRYRKSEPLVLRYAPRE